jgi:hypothetical protein
MNTQGTILNLRSPMSELTPYKNNLPQVSSKPHCPQCGNEIASFRDAIVVVDPYRNKTNGYCMPCYKLELETIDLERDIGMHGHMWQWMKDYWWCTLCDKKVNIPEDESRIESRRPDSQLGMEKYKILPPTSSSDERKPISQHTYWQSISKLCRRLFTILKSKITEMIWKKNN